MSLLIKNGTIFYRNKLCKLDILINKDKIININKHISVKTDQTIDATNLTIIPGLIDVHVHLREPGFEYKETIETGTKAAAAGGFTTICCMPNTKPIIDNLSRLNALKQFIRSKAMVNVLPYVAISNGQLGKELVDIKSLSKHCFAFSDDGVGIQSALLMEIAMCEAKKYSKPIVAHCEDLTKTGNAMEYSEVGRDLKIALKNKCQFHICHVSTKESIDLIYKAKQHASFISCEITPHHLLLNKTLLKNNGAYKMNPPIASKQDQQALIKNLQNGTIDMIATDHAPHSKEEKSKGLLKSANGVVGLEISFALMYTYLVKKHIITFNRLIELMSVNPAKIFHLNGGTIKIGGIADLSIFNLNQK
jgi:dihydroorotase